MLSLPSLGFVFVHDHNIERKRPEDVSWQLGCGGRRDVLTKRNLFTLSAGLRFDSLESILQWDKEPHSPTLSVPTHMLHPNRDFFEWDATIPDIVTNMVEEIKKYALPFFEYYEKPENLLGTLEQQDPNKWPFVGYNARIELVCALLYTQGRQAESLIWIDREIGIERELEMQRGKPPGRRRRLERLRARLNRNHPQANH
jgi:hypothetical protein